MKVNQKKKKAFLIAYASQKMETYYITISNKEIHSPSAICDRWNPRNLG